MLPGFRFLFAAIVLSMSILVFGLGAAALLRAAHEEFASTPTWQPAPETRFAQSREASQPATPPVLAMLRVDDAPKDASNDAPKTDQPASDNAPATAAAPIKPRPSLPSPIEAAPKSPSPKRSPRCNRPLRRRRRPPNRKPGYRKLRSRNLRRRPEAAADRRSAATDAAENRRHRTTRRRRQAKPLRRPATAVETAAGRP